MSETQERELTQEEMEALYNKDTARCETIHQPCARPVAWADIYPCCGHRTLLCDPHKTRIQKLRREMLARPDVSRVRCPRCNTSHRLEHKYIPV